MSSLILSLVGVILYIETLIVFHNSYEHREDGY